MAAEDRRSLNRGDHRSRFDCKCHFTASGLDRNVGRVLVLVLCISFENALYLYKFHENI